MGKKKATGMSKRLGFTDRATINENKDILRYNERLEREAQGLPPEEPRRRAPRTGGRGEGSASAPGGHRPRPDGARRPPRQARPPALDDEQTAVLTAAYLAVVGESGLEPAADKVIERIAAHDGFERATMAGWEVAAGGHADARTAQEWELLRNAWLAVRLALLEAYATFKPEAAEVLAREKKQQARLAKPPRPRRRPGNGPGRRRSGKPQPASGPRTPSPADVARHVAAHGSTPEEAAAALSAGPADGLADEPAAEPTARAAAEPVAEPAAQPSPEVAPPVEGTVPAPTGVTAATEPSPETSPPLDVTPEQAPTEPDASPTAGADPDTDVALPDTSADVPASTPEEGTPPEPLADREPTDTEPTDREAPDAEPIDAEPIDAEPAEHGPAVEHQQYGAAPDEKAASTEVDEGQMALDL